MEFEEKPEFTGDSEETTETLSANASILKIKILNILIAEDNDSNYLLIRNLLNENYLTRAHTGAEAVEKAKTEMFDVILMDMRMPVMNGLEATSTIREFNKDRSYG